MLLHSVFVARKFNPSQNFGEVMEQVAAESKVGRVARCLIGRYGGDARMNAILRSERARLDGDFMGYKAWKAVGIKVFALQRQQAAGGELN